MASHTAMRTRNNREILAGGGGMAESAFHPIFFYMRFMRKCYRLRWRKILIRNRIVIAIVYGNTRNCYPNQTQNNIPLISEIFISHLFTQTAIN